MFTSDVERFGQRLDADLLSVSSDQAYFSGPDPLVDPGIGCGNWTSPFRFGGLGPGTRKRRTEVRRSSVARLQALLSTRRTSHGGRVGSREQLLDSHLPCKLSGLRITG